MSEIKVTIKPNQRIYAKISVGSGGGGSQRVDYGSSYEAHINYPAVITQTTVVNINEE